MIKHSEEFKQEAVRIALTSGLSRGLERRLAVEAHAALDAAAALVPGVMCGEQRWRLLGKARRLVEMLEGGELQRPMF